MLLPWLTVNGLLGGVDTIGVEVLSGEGEGEEGMVMRIRMCVHVVYNRVATSGPHNCGHGRGGQRPGSPLCRHDHVTLSMNVDVEYSTPLNAPTRSTYPTPRRHHSYRRGTRFLGP